MSLTSNREATLEQKTKVVEKKIKKLESDIKILKTLDDISVTV